MGNARDLASQIDDLLPQTQCEQCGHPGCRPYAEAIAGGAAHNRCPPGGVELEARLARLLDRPSLPLDVPTDSQPGKRLEAVIREEECIGCTKCIAACPVDAIVGARQFMHTVISQECTGCELCVAPCPVDCIDMVLRPAAEQSLDDATRFHARERFQARNARLAQKQQAEKEKRATRRKRQLLSRPIEALPETSLNQLKAAWQKARTQHQQLQAAISHMRRHGQTPQPDHLAQEQALAAEVAERQRAVAAAMEAAKQTLTEQGADLTELKLAATRSELAWRRAQIKGVDDATLTALKARRDADQARLVTTMNMAGLSDPD